MSTTELLGRLVGVFFPIFAIVGVGFWYGRKHKPEMAAANRINMDIFIPAVVFAAMAGKSFDVQAYVPLAAAAFVLLAVCGAIAWGVAHLLGVQAKTLAPPMMFNNSGNIGLPLAMLAWGEAAMPAAVIMFVVENIFHFTFGARLLDPKARVLTLWRMPVVFASFAGVAVALLKIELWQPALTGIKMLGDISIPLMLFSLGVRMSCTALPSPSAITAMSSSPKRMRPCNPYSAHIRRNCPLSASSNVNRARNAPSAVVNSLMCVGTHAGSRASARA